MKVGDLVKVDNYLSSIGGKTGVVIKIQDVDHCIGAYILMEQEVKLIRVENLTVIQQGVSNE